LADSVSLRYLDLGWLCRTIGNPVFSPDYSGRLFERWADGNTGREDGRSEYSRRAGRYEYKDSSR